MRGQNKLKYPSPNFKDYIEKSGGTKNTPFVEKIVNLHRLEWGFIVCTKYEQVTSFVKTWKFNVLVNQINE